MSRPQQAPWRPRSSKGALSPLQAWWLSKLETGVLLNGGWPGLIAKQALFRDYVDTLTQAGATRIPNETEFWMGLRQCLPALRRVRRRIDRRLTWCEEVPPLAACRAAWDSAPWRDRQQTLRGAIAHGQVRAMPIGRDWLITLRGSDLDRWQRRSA